MSQRAGTAGRTPAQTFALVFGVVYLLIGVAGFFVTGFEDFAGKTYDEELIIFPVNPLHNIVHILLGAVWLYGAKTHDMAKKVNVFLGVAYLLVFVLGIAGVLKFLAIEDASSTDNYLHLVSGLLSVYFGTAGAGDSTAAGTTGRPAV